jgi:hypothetical protein
MRKPLFLLALLLIPFLSEAQPGVGFAVSTSYDFEVDLGRLQGYTPLGKGRTSLFSFDASLRLPLVKDGWLNLYPTFIYGIPARSNIVANDDGDYLPDGYLIQRPFDVNGPSVIYNDPYPDLHGTAEVWQKSYGGFLTLGKSFQVGTGLFLRQKRTDYYRTLLVDEFWYGDSEGTTYDNYYYMDTWVDSYEQQSVEERLLAVPFILKYDLQYNWWYTGGSFIYWAGQDGYLSFRYSMGVNF